MTADIDEIAKSIEATNPTVERMRFIVDCAQRTANLEVNHIFVSEYLTKKDDELKRVYSSIWLFADDYILEAKNFIVDTKIDCHRISFLNYWEIEYIDFPDIDNPQPNSRINLSLDIVGAAFSGQFHATGNNCTYLLELLHSEIIPKLGT